MNPNQFNSTITTNFIHFMWIFYYPKYVFLTMEAMIDAAVHLGFPRETAIKLVTATIKGSATYSESSPEDVTTLRANVTIIASIIIDFLISLKFFFCVRLFKGNFTRWYDSVSFVCTRKRWFQNSRGRRDLGGLQACLRTRWKR